MIDLDQTAVAEPTRRQCLSDGSRRTPHGFGRGIVRSGVSGSGFGARGSFGRGVFEGGNVDGGSVDVGIRARLRLGLVAVPLFAAQLLAVPGSVDAQLAFVPNSGAATATAVSTRLSDVGDGVDAVIGDVSVGLEPVSVVFNNAGTRVYVIPRAQDRVLEINTFNAQPVRQGVIGASAAGGAISADDQKLYVADGGDGTVSVLSTDSMNRIGTIPVGSDPFGVAIEPDGARVFVANRGDGTVSVIDTSSDVVVDTLTGLSSPSGLAVSVGGDELFVVETDADRVARFDLGTLSPTATVAVGLGPWSVATHPDGATVYVTNAGDGTVSTVDLGTGVVTATTTVGTTPHGIDVPDRGGHAYVANFGSDSLSVIDLADGTVVDTVPVGAGPEGIGPFIAPDHLCPATRVGGCRRSSKGSLSIKISPDGASKISYKWSKGSASLGDFGEPNVATDYAFCLYDARGRILSAELPADPIHWTALPSEKGYAYKQPDVAVEGFRAIQLKPGGNGKAKARAQLQGPTLPAFDTGLPTESTVYAFLVSSTNRCLETQFRTSGIKKNSAEPGKTAQFKATRK